MIKNEQIIWSRVSERNKTFPNKTGGTTQCHETGGITFEITFLSLLGMVC